MDDTTSRRIADVFSKQRSHRPTMAATTAAARVDRLRQLGAAIAGSREALYEAFRADFGKPRAEVELTEIQPTLVEIRHTCSHLRRWMKPKRVGTPLLLFGTTSRIRTEPKGVVLILSPWNYPLYLLVNPLVAAVAAGNCVMLRPSEKVPHVSALLTSLIGGVFPENEVAVFRGGREVANALLELPFDHVFFTGSPAVGRKVMAAAARHLTPVTLELGGKSPAVVDATANPRRAAERIVWGKLVNGGQTCVAPDYVLVHESLEQEFLTHAAAAVAATYGETEEARATNRDFCRIVDTPACARLAQLVAETVAGGARVVTGGTPDPERRYMPATILAGVRPDAPVMAAELFGPVLPVLTYSTLDEILAITRAHPNPLALYVFCRNRRDAERIIAAVPAGGTCINTTILHLANSNLPFGGIGESGMGSYHGHFGFLTFSHQRAVLRQREPALVSFFYPPYRPSVEKLIRLAGRLVT